MKKKNFVSRRQAISMMGLCGAASFLKTPSELLISGLVDGVFSRAQAQATGTQPRNHIYVNLNGGPARWFWDLPLVPYAGNLPVLSNPHVNTKFSDAGISAGQPEYQTVAVTRQGVTLNMPSLWSTDIPTVGGGQVPMVNLLDNMLMIRGVNMRMDGHPDNNDKQVRPLMAAPSLGGLVADRSHRPLPAVGLPGGPNGVFKSGRGIGQVQLESYSDPLRKIMQPFSRTADALAPAYLSRRQALDAALERALASLGEYARSSGAGSESLETARKSAEALIRQGIGDVSGEYTRLLAKYSALIDRCAIDPVPGVTDKPVRYSDMIVANGFTPQTSVHEGFIRNADLRTVLQTSSNPGSLAEGFAVAEYLIKNKLSSAVTLGSGRVFGLRFEDLRDRATPTVAGTTGAGTWGYDEHFGGSVLSVIINTFLFRCLSACLYEFINVLKADGLFDESVIQIGAEFSRNPRRDQSGSDHGWMANCTSLFSGSIKKPMVLGNTLLDSPYADGTWGAAATVQVDGAKQQLTIGHSTSTVAHLLRVQPILSNNGTLVAETTSGLEPTIELAQNKETV